MTIVEPAPAKINLALHVRRRRPDGYHDIETLFAFCRDGDVVTVKPAEIDSFALTGPFAGALAGESGNLVLAARDAFAARIAPLPPLAITLDKRLPVASGIGGGSADAAATLRALARLRGVAPEDLADIALGLGSDVPACLFGRSAIGEGRGEALVAIDLPPSPVLLVNPLIAVSTAAVFQRWDGKDRGPLVRIEDRSNPPPPGGCVSAADRGGGTRPLTAAPPPPPSPLAPPPLGGGGLRRGMKWLDIASAGRNDLEPPARAIAPFIGGVLAALQAQPGVTLARMSGSGATCFALFADAAACAAAANAVRAAHPGWWLLESTLA